VRKPNESELYNAHMTGQQKMELHNAINNKLNQNVGIITPEHIQAEVVQLETKAKKNPGLLPDALAYFKTFNGRIKLFNLGATSAGRSPVPPFIPFLPGNARNRQLEGESGNRGVSPAIFVNMYRIGKWAADESSYNIPGVPTDLLSCLESGVIAHKLLIEQKSEKLFSNSVVLNRLTNIYTTLFSGAVIKTVVTFGSEFNTDAARYLIAKFFLIYVLKKPESDTINSVAYNSIKYRTSQSGLESFEENYPMDYSSLSGFLATLGEAFFNKKIELSRFTVSWITMYGEGLLFAIEYVPYLLHFLFATVHGAMLGGSNKLYSYASTLEKDGLIKLYNAVITELR
jgi:hypothetical protein